MQAPDFILQDQNGVTHHLRDYAGKWLVLYFYRMDDTPGCTTEACSFRDARELIADLGGAEVVGVSKDSVESHKAFADKHNLNFTLLSDPDHAVLEAYGAWQGVSEKDSVGIKRNTVVIDPSGNIVKRYEGVDPDMHAAQIIADLKQLQSRR